MSNHTSICPHSTTNVRFVAYVLTADFEYNPESGSTITHHIIHSRYESPNPFSARRNAICEVRRIKCMLDQGLSESKYQYEGLKLWLEYQISQPCSDSTPEIKRLYLLDGETGTHEDLIQRLYGEEFLLDVMDYSFVSSDPEDSEELDYAGMTDLLFDGLKEFDKTCM